VSFSLWNLYYVYCLYCHQGMAHAQVLDGGDSLRIWRVSVNILNKKSWTADKGWSSSFGVGRGENLLWKIGRSPWYLQDKTWVGPRVSLDAEQERKFLLLPRMEPWFLGCPVQLPYWLSHPGSLASQEKFSKIYGKKWKQLRVIYWISILASTKTWRNKTKLNNTNCSYLL
jgi:hypothetical protein